MDRKNCLARSRRTGYKQGLVERMLQYFELLLYGGEFIPSWKLHQLGFPEAESVLLVAMEQSVVEMAVSYAVPPLDRYSALVVGYQSEIDLAEG